MGPASSRNESSLIETPFRVPDSRACTVGPVQDLPGSDRWEEGEVRSFHRSFSDTFDWRLHAEGLVLERRTGGGVSTLTLRGPGAEVLGESREPVTVTFARDVKDGELRKAIEPFVEVRALMPQVEMATTQREWVRRNKRGKIVVRLRLEDNRISGTDGRDGGARLCQFIVVQVKGYRKACRDTVRFLREDRGLEQSPGLASEAFAALGIDPGGYSAKPVVALNERLPAWLATRKILLRLLSVMERNERGVREDIDSEFLHDFRIAVRSTRAIMGQMRRVVPRAATVRFLPDFAWLGAISGPTRDLDVYLLKFEKFQGLLPKRMRRDLEPLKLFLHGEKLKEQRILGDTLGSSRYRRLVREWRAFLESDGDAEELPREASRPVGIVASRRIWKLFRRMIREGRAITEESAPADFHELRKTCKKLRYMIELFRTLYPPENVARLITPLKGLQECLGEFQDYQMQTGALARYLSAMEGAGEVSSDTREAISLLGEKMEREQTKARSGFAARFAKLDRPGVKEGARALFKAREKSGATREGP